VLKEVFDSRLLGHLKIKATLVTAYDVFGRQAIVFKSHKPEHYSLRVWDVVKASCSAPAYFPAHIMQVGGVDVPMIDGGVVANNSTACAIAEAVRLNSPPHKPQPCEISNLVVASFGTGEAIRRIEPSEATEWGALEWALPLIDVLFDGSADSVHYIATQLLPTENYFRFQTVLDKAYDDIDNADRTNLEALQRLAVQYIDQNEPQARLKALAAMLK
jgi:hypothetical protein